LPVVSNTLRDELFPETGGEDGPRSVFITGHTLVVFLMKNHKTRYMPRDTTYICLF
jgi:hypothetical protein